MLNKDIIPVIPQLGSVGASGDLTPLSYLSRMGRAINRRESCGEKYTRILIPSFVFIIFADIFFTIFSIFEGGFFRGWLSKK